MRSGFVCLLVLLAAQSAAAATCRDERLIVGVPAVLPSTPEHEVAREVSVQVRTCIGSPVDRMLSAGQGHLRPAFQDVPASDIAVIGEDPVKRAGSRPMVLIHAGRPGTKDAPPAPVMAAAAQLARTHPDWEYHFIRGDEQRCLLSAALRSLAWNADIPLHPEHLEAMAATFTDSDAPRALVIVAEEPPVWLPREVTEWFFDPSRIGVDDEDARKAAGLAEQTRIRERGVAGMLLGRLFDANRLVLVSGPGTTGMSAVIQEVAETHDGAVPLGALAARTKACGVPVTYAGKVRFDMSAVRRHPSGQQPFEVQLVDAKQNVLLRGSQVFPDATRRDWERELLRDLPTFLMVLGAIIAVVFIAVSQLSGDPEAYATLRNAAVGLAGTCLATAIAILPNAETAAHEKVFHVAMSGCMASVLFAIIFGALSLDLERERH